MKHFANISLNPSKAALLTGCTLILITVMVSCKKGDQGVPGPAGTTGATGATGEQGALGTANVIYSDWKYATNFNDSTIDNSLLKVAYVSAPAITSAILTSGTVIVYFTYGGGTFILPYTSNAGGKPNTISFTPMLNKILVTRFTHDNSNSIALSTSLQYRYIVIPGGVSGRQAYDFDWNDYAAVARHFGFKD